MKHFKAIFGGLWLLAGCGSPGAPVLLNDIHSRLNETLVASYHEPSSKVEIVGLVQSAARDGLSISISGGKHSMGGQQFGEGTLHINMSRYASVIGLDQETGWVTVESGIQWPKLIGWLIETQKGQDAPWAIRQKQTGADNLSLGGAVSSNIHGRGLTMPPFVGDVESLEIVNAEGELITCSRAQNSELFSLVVGGYGLFGVITEVTLRLSPRIKLERKVEIIDVADVPTRVQERIADGYLFGDYQFKTDESSPDFLRKGIFSFYKPTDAAPPVEIEPKRMRPEDWQSLYKLAHFDKAAAFETYSNYYLSTDGQIYWSDTHQISYYVEGVDALIDDAAGVRAPGSLMICEFYVPGPRLPEFLEAMAHVVRREKANLIYGTVRFIESDTDSFLAWAKQPYTCIVVNLRVTHDEQGIQAAKQHFRSIIDAALALDGSYFLTYHRWARKDQVLKAYPEFPEFLRRKLKFDPSERFQSDWYRHYREMFAEEIAE
ncbi:MAG: FAD-binding oxidoreductase [Planctomycetes bacterium]|nr:FAD-binding oxidoreductase [Planctomycetota bacterium]